MRNVTVQLTTEAEQALKEGGWGSVELLLYDFLNLPNPSELETEGCSSWVVYRDLPVIVFPGDLDKYFAVSAAHVSLCGSGDTAEEAGLSCKRKIDEMLAVRVLSRAELMSCKALAKGREAVYKLSGKEAVASLARSLESGLSNELCKGVTDSYLLASRLASTLSGVQVATVTWAENNMLKYPIVTTNIEAAIDKMTAMSARLALHQANLM